MQWHNEPLAWRADGDVLIVTAGAKTDFWRKTHDSGVRDSGHFYFRPVTGDFVAQVKVSGQYAALYDQAGLMVRLDETTWLKCGIEYVNGVQYASTVVTRDWSDWSIRPLDNPPAIWLKLERHGATMQVYVSTDGVAFEMIRQAYLSEQATQLVGPMLAAPTGDGFAVRFDGLSIERA